MRWFICSATCDECSSLGGVSPIAQGVEILDLANDSIGYIPQPVLVL
jgi:hypothetical protein